MANVTVQIDSNLKAQAEDLLAEMGLDFATWMTLATEALVREQAIPFDDPDDPFYSATNQRILAERYAHYRQHEAISRHALVDDE